MDKFKNTPIDKFNNRGFIKTLPIMLPTTNASNLGIGNTSKQLVDFSGYYEDDFGLYQNQFLYLVSDDIPNVGDWVHKLGTTRIELCVVDGFDLHKDFKKIITTNDLSLNLPTIPTKVIEDWVSSEQTLKEVYLKPYTDWTSGEGFTYKEINKPNLINKDVVGKYIIVKDLTFSDFMKDDKGNIEIYDTRDDALLTCGMYEFEDVIILKVEYNHMDI